MLTAFNISQQGESHRQRSIPCQDASFTRRIPYGCIPETDSSSDGNTDDKAVVIGVTADGIGQCAFSDRGAQTAVGAAADYLICRIPSVRTLTDDSVYGILRAAMEKAQEAVRLQAEKEQNPYISYFSTLTLGIFDGKSFWFGHAGDDGIVVLYTDGTYEMITSRHKGEYAGSVIPFEEESVWEFGKARGEVAAAAMMTDGILDYCVGSEAMHNVIRAGFVVPMLTNIMDTDEAAEESRKEWEELLGELPEESRETRVFRMDVTDDITLALMQNPEAVGKLQDLSCEEGAWRNECARGILRRVKTNKKLFAAYRKFKSHLTGPREEI